MYRRREFVERKLTPIQAKRIDHEDTASRRVPQSSIRGLAETRAEAAAQRDEPEPLGIVENRGLYLPLRIFDPRMQLRPGNAHQAAGRVQPDLTGVVLHHPVDGIAGQSVLAAQRNNTAVFHLA